MKTSISRYFLFGLLLGWSLSHANVFGQATGTASSSAAVGGGTGTTTTATTAEKLRASLEKKVTLDFTGNSLNDAINHFRDKTGIAIHIDPMALGMIGIGDGNDGGIQPNIVQPGIPGVIVQPNQGQFKLKSTDEKAGQVLRRMLNPYSLTYVIMQDALLVTTEEMAVLRQYRQRVSVDLEDVAMKKAVRDLAKNHGISLVIDPKVAKQSDTLVSLQLDNASIETTLRLLAELAGLKAVRMGNVIFVTTDEKAKKIRDEEQHQFDNPLNPNNPGGGIIPQMLRGMVGGGFGGIAAQGFAGPGAQAVPVPLNPDVAPPPPGIEPAAPPVKKEGVQSSDPAPAKKRIIEINPEPGSSEPSVGVPTAPPRPLPPGRNE
ncbi:MAG: hypothetical protein EXS16_16025 [Gemmataceae bacterium]|nr:hypothetical protein [Gemmataceae bacterium]